jgi:hypothetical protein
MGGELGVRDDGFLSDEDDPNVREKEVNAQEAQKEPSSIYEIELVPHDPLHQRRK